MTVRSNPRIVIVFTVVPVIILAGVGLLFLLGVWLGLLALAAALFLSWTILRFARRQLSSQVETLADEIVFTLLGSERLALPWKQVRVAGIATDVAARKRRGRARRLFVYDEQDDRMFALTDEFENLDGLASELREKTDFREIELSPGETLKDRLLRLVGRF
jgi:uncharacterized membrane protein